MKWFGLFLVAAAGYCLLGAAGVTSERAYGGMMVVLLLAFLIIDSACEGRRAQGVTERLARRRRSHEDMEHEEQYGRRLLRAIGMSLIALIAAVLGESCGVRDAGYLALIAVTALLLLSLIGPWLGPR